MSVAEPRRGSDPEGWVEQHGDYLFRNAVLRVRDPSVAEEVVQETFLAALEARDRFVGHSSERTWLVGILKHKVFDHFRRSARERTDSQQDMLGGAVQEQFDKQGSWLRDTAGPKEWEDPSTLLDRQQFWQALNECLDRLPPRLRNVFTLREIDDVSSEEIHVALKISKSNLWVMLHRARAQLRRCLETAYMGVAGQKR